MERKRTEISKEDKEKLERWIADIEDMAYSRGKYEYHILPQVGRCVYCSCGTRYQGSIPRDR